jgi:hypothetical protein
MLFLFGILLQHIHRWLNCLIDRGRWIEGFVLFFGFLIPSLFALWSFSRHGDLLTFRVDR